MAGASVPTTSVPLEKYRGDFQLEGKDGVPFTVSWLWSPSIPTRRANGITGWARVDGQLDRVHVCFHIPCRADWKDASKYGNKPVPRHGRVPGSASSAVAEAEPLTATAAEGASGAVHATAVVTDNAEAAVAAATPPASASTGAGTSEQALPAQTGATAADPTDCLAVPCAPAPAILETQPLPEKPSISETPPLPEAGGSMPALDALEPKILAISGEVEIPPAAVYPPLFDILEIPSTVAEAMPAAAVGLS